MSQQSSWNRLEYGPSIIAQRVFFSGTTAVRRGMGLCFDLTATTGAGTDTGALTAADSPRMQNVAVPTTTNSGAFAGVALAAHAADADGQVIDIALPGSICDVEIGTATVNNTGLLTCSVNTVDAGAFVQAGFAGKGSFLPLQTVAVHATADGLVYSDLVGLGALDTTGKQITAASAVVGNILVGDILVVYGVEDDGTDNGTAIKTTPVTAIDGDSTVYDVGVALSTTGGHMQIAYYVYRGSRPTCRGLLLDGEQSGLTQYVNVASADAAQTMVGGVSYLGPQSTLASASTATLADGTYPGEKKGFILKGTLGTAGYDLTCTSGTSHGVSAGVSVAWAGATFNTAGDCLIAIWCGGGWRSLPAGDASTGPVFAAS